MKKRITLVFVFITVVLLVFSTSLSALARWSYTQICDPRLSFSGTTANCTLYIKAYDESAEITATLKLIREYADGTETVVKTWSDQSGTGSLMFSDKKSVISGQTYRLEVSAKVKTDDGSEYPSEYVRATCP